MTAPDRFLTVAEIAAELRLTPLTIRRWITTGKLPAVRITERDYRIERADYEQLVESLKVEPQ